MKRHKLILILVSLLLFSAGTGAYAALTSTVNFGGGTYADLESNLQGAINAQLAKYSDLPDLTRGFGNANTYASNGATMRGYQGYDLFSIAIGTMVTVQAPDADPKFYTKMQQKLDSGDIYAGLGVNPIVGQIGLNLGFIIPDLYISFRFGKLNYKVDAGDYKLDYDTNLFGILLDYQLISSKSILAGMLLWKGLNLESGFIYSTNDVVYFKKIKNPITASGVDGAITYTATFDPSLDMELNIKSYIIPVELYSAFRLFYIINFGAGIGFDYVCGNTTDLTLHSTSNAVITASSVPAAVGKTGTVDIHAGTKGEADKFRLKFMANVGLSAGPVIVDVPLTFYLDNGYAVGLSAGIVW